MSKRVPRISERLYRFQQEEGIAPRDLLQPGGYIRIRFETKQMTQEPAYGRYIHTSQRHFCEDTRSRQIVTQFLHDLSFITTVAAHNQQPRPSQPLPQASQPIQRSRIHPMQIIQTQYQTGCTPAQVQDELAKRLEQVQAYFIRITRRWLWQIRG